MEEEKNNLIIFIIFGKSDIDNNINNNGFIDISLVDGKFFIKENCNRFEIYNKIIKLNNNDEIYNICYYSKENNIKGKIFYSIEPQNFNENNLHLFYLNNFINSENNIENIIFN